MGQYHFGLEKKRKRELVLGTNKKTETEPDKVRLSTTIKNQLQKLADENERTLAGQIRLALNEWIENKSRGARK